ncbi:MAG: MlaD family protein [Candidatus Omnitrophota bacterium]|nr:MlaD family protein [Candidatus Omnitrophota bacterium]
MNKKGLELKVGIFIIIAAALFVMIVFSMGDMNVFFKTGYEFKIIFGFVSGLEVSAPVRLAGVTVGEVKKVKRFYDGESGKDQVEILVWVKGDVKVRQGAEIYINTLGMLGEKYIEIFSSGDEEAKLLKSGDKIVGYDPVPLEKLIRINQENLIALHEILGNSDTKKSIGEILNNTRELTRNLKEITDRINKGKGTLGRLVNEDNLYQNLKDFSKDIKAHPWKLLHKQKVRTEDTEGAKEESTPRRKKKRVMF